MRTKKIFTFISCLMLLLFSSCEPYFVKTIFDFPGTKWKTDETDDIQMLLSVENEQKVTGVVSYTGLSFECKVKHIQNVFIFTSVSNKELTFSIEHSFVINDNYLKCKTLFNIVSMFPEGVEGLEFSLRLCEDY